eukprot:gene28982-32170_t
MPTVNVSIKWGKENFPNVEADLEQSPMVFKSQVFTLTGVPPDRQKVMIKGGMLKDDDWGKQVPKAGSTVMVMGSANAVVVEAPKEPMVWMEDLPEDEQLTLGTKAYGSGLQNLGNTCYMNSTVQLLYTVEPLRDALQSFRITQPDLSSKLTAATGELMKDLKSGGVPFSPFKFLLTLRERYPQFAQTGEGGAYVQQDAEECWTNIVYTLHEKLKDAEGNSVLDSLFGLTTRLKLKSEESGEEIEETSTSFMLKSNNSMEETSTSFMLKCNISMEETSTSFMLKCNISMEVNHLHEGIKLGLKDDREKASEALGRTALFTGSSVITRLPSYLPVQLVRFFYKVDTQNKAKVLRKNKAKVLCKMELDCYDFCSDELKKQLDGPRQAYKEYQDMLIEQKKIQDTKKDDKPADAGATSGGDAEMKDTTQASTSSVEVNPHTTQASTSSVEVNPHVGALTGRYELQAVLTHKGRSADSGHYVAWTRQKDKKWVLFDDDDLTIRTDEDILGLSGGGDWHMAYLLLFKAITVPVDTPAPKAAISAAPADAVMKDA